MRRLVLAAAVVGLLVAAPVAAAKPMPGLTGDPARFEGQTGQVTIVRQAFLGWNQGVGYGAPLGVLISSLGPIPMLHLGTKGQGGQKVVITPGQIAHGAGDAWLASLNLALSHWGKAAYVRPMAEMNNSGNPWSGSPAAYVKAFARIYVLIHGGTPEAVNSALHAAGLPPYSGPSLGDNPFPRVRVLWSPLAGGADPGPYYPGDQFVDVVGGDIYKEQGAPPWPQMEALAAFAKSHRKPWSVPEWGMFGIDAPDFVDEMCAFLKRHPTETQEFYESKPGSIFDLGNKPLSRAAYRKCITPFAGPAPPWAEGGPGSGRQLALKLVPTPATGGKPLAVTFAVTAKLSVPIAHWQVLFGDGGAAQGDGEPPATVPHTYAADGSYSVQLAVYASPPYDFAQATFKAMATVKVGAGDPLVSIVPSATSAKAGTTISFHMTSGGPKVVKAWDLVYGDGLDHAVAGPLPHFGGHTYTAPGLYTVTLIVQFAGSAAPVVAVATVHIT